MAPSSRFVGVCRGRRTALGASFVVALGALLAALVWAPSAGAVPPPRDFMGVTAWKHITGTDYSRLGRGSVRLYRMDLSWYRVERDPPRADGTHVYDWSFYDRQFRLAARHGVRILPIVIGSPRWVARRPSHQPRSPSSKAAFDAFATAAAKRYGPSGTLWRQRPWSPTAPAPPAVRALYWQVWNEPNTPNNWKPEPRPREYAGMVKRVSRALNRAASSIRVMTAGVVWPHEGIPPESYLPRLLAVRGLRAAVDIFAIHPYGKTPFNVMQLVRRARGTLNSSGGSRHSMWITEVGWATGTYDGLIVPEPTQARYLDDLYRHLVAERRPLKLLGAVWFAYRDLRPQAGDTYRRYWGRTLGLLRADSSPKPAWRTFTTRARSGY